MAAYNPAKALSEGFFRVPTFRSRIGSCGPQCPLQIPQIMDVTLGVDLLGLNRMRKIEVLRHGFPVFSPTDLGVNGSVVRMIAYDRGRGEVRK